MKFNEMLRIQTQISKLGGVISLSDFANLVGLSDSQKVKYKLNQFIKNKIIKRFINGFYINDSPNLEVLSQKIYPNSYISLGNILAKNLVIGSIPEKTIYAVKLGRTKEFSNDQIRIKYFSICKDFFLDFEIKNGIKYASPEKAFIDLFYYYQKGFKASFNIFSDINISLLNISKIEVLLESYKNKKFKTFVLGVVGEYRNKI